MMDSKQVIQYALAVVLAVSIAGCNHARYIPDPQHAGLRLQLIECPRSDMPEQVLAAFHQAHPEATDLTTYKQSYEKGLGTFGSGWIHNGWSIEYTASGRRHLAHYPLNVSTSQRSPSTQPDLR